MTKYLKNSNFYLLIAFVIMALLFYSSAQTYEQQSKIGLLEKLFQNEPFKQGLGKVNFAYAGNEVSIQNRGYAGFVEFFIRKGAHFFTYFLLGGSWFLGLNIRWNQPLLIAVVSWLCATGYAGLDEFHQMITGGRSPLFQDVMLDSAGAATAVIFCLLVIGIKKLRKK